MQTPLFQIEPWECFCCHKKVDDNFAFIEHIELQCGECGGHLHMIVLKVCKDCYSSVKSAVWRGCEKLVEGLTVA